jgi:hypothetical protein
VGKDWSGVFIGYSHHSHEAMLKLLLPQSLFSHEEAQKAQIGSADL